MPFFQTRYFNVRSRKGIRYNAASENAKLQPRNAEAYEITRLLSRKESTGPTPLPAFPTAEGYGKFTVGGRGGTVYEVTNLADSGPGRLLAGVEAQGPLTIIFRISGTIDLERPLTIRGLGHQADTARPGAFSAEITAIKADQGFRRGVWIVDNDRYARQGWRRPPPVCRRPRDSPPWHRRRGRDQ